MAPNPLAPGIAEAAWLKAGAAEVQPWGTDNTPSDAARPTPALTAAPPIPGEPTAAAPEPQPLLSTGPNAWNPVPKVLVVDPIGFISELAEPSIDMPEVDIDADDAAPDSRLVPEVSAVDDVIVVDVVDETEVAADASPSAALGIAAEVSGAVNKHGDARRGDDEHAPAVIPQGS